MQFHSFQIAVYRTLESMFTFARTIHIMVSQHHFTASARTTLHCIYSTRNEKNKNKNKNKPSTDVI